MCYSGCRWENYYGECAKPGKIPCPEDEEEMEAYEESMDLAFEEGREMVDEEDE